MTQLRQGCQGRCAVPIVRVQALQRGQQAHRGVTRGVMQLEALHAEILDIVVALQLEQLQRDQAAESRKRHQVHITPLHTADIHLA